MGQDDESLTESERLFEECLDQNGFTAWERHPDVPDSLKHPDYRVSVDGLDTFFEVKEFDSEHLPPGFVGFHDPYAPIRSKLNEAQRQLHPAKGKPCAVVLYRGQSLLVDLDPFFIFAAMLGDVGVSMPFDPATASLDASRGSWGFLARGKMIRYLDGKPLHPQNTTISAVCVLRHINERSRRIWIDFARWRTSLGRKPTFDEQFVRVQELSDTHQDVPEARLAMGVVENPYALAHLPSVFGSGDFDERIGVVDNYLCRRFVGPGLKQLEDEEDAAGIKARDLLGLRSSIEGEEE